MTNVIVKLHKNCMKRHFISRNIRHFYLQSYGIRVTYCNQKKKIYNIFLKFEISFILKKKIYYI